MLWNKNNDKTNIDNIDKTNDTKNTNTPRDNDEHRKNKNKRWGKFYGDNSRCLRLHRRCPSTTENVFVLMLTMAIKGSGGARPSEALLHDRNKLNSTATMI